MTITTLHWKSAVSGGFNVGSNWSGGAVPGSSNNAFIDATGASYTVTSPASETIHGLEVSSTGTTLSITVGTFDVNAFADNAGAINVGGGATLALGSSSTPGATFAFHNSHVVNLTSSASAATLEINDEIVNLKGLGSLVLSNSALNRIIGGSAASTLTNVDNTISGAGTIGSATLTLKNAILGTINANDSVALTLNTGANAILNNGLIESTGSGGLVIDSNMFEDGTLLADGTGAVKIANGATVQGLGQMKAAVSGASFVLSNGIISFGGLLSTVAGSSIKTASGTTDTVDAFDFQNAGLFEVADNSTLILNAGITNAGTIELGVTAAAKLEIGTSNSALYGTGHVVLTDNAFNKVLSTGAAAQLTNFGNTISGSGTIGDAFLRTVNLQGGVINSNGTAGMTLVGDTPTSTLKSSYNDGVIETTGSGGMTVNGIWDNAGFIEAAGTGQLTLANFADTSGGGTVETTTSGARILLSGVDIVGGVFSIAAGSTVSTKLGTTNTLPNRLVNAGTLNLTNSTLVLGNHAFNSGALILTGSTTADKLMLGSGSGFTNFENGGHLTLGDTLGNSIVSNGSAQLLNNVDNTILGFGTIGDANMTVHNDLGATIDANSANKLKISTGTNTVDNAGLIESTAAGGLTIFGALYNAGTLESTAGDLDVAGPVTGLGRADIVSSGEIEFGAGSSVSTLFGGSGAGELRLDRSTTAGDAYTGDIYGFGNTDKIDFADVLFGAGTHFSYFRGLGHGALTITDGTHTSTVNFEGNYITGSFAIASDGHGGTFLK